MPASCRVARSRRFYCNVSSATELLQATDDTLDAVALPVEVAMSIQSWRQLDLNGMIELSPCMSRFSRKESAVVALVGQHDPGQPLPPVREGIDDVSRPSRHCVESCRKWRPKNNGAGGENAG